jgi:hypothetical protein
MTPYAAIAIFHQYENKRLFIKITIQLVAICLTREGNQINNISFTLAKSIL